MPTPKIRDGVSSAASGNVSGFVIGAARGNPLPGDLRLLLFRVNASAAPEPPTGWTNLGAFRPSGSSGSYYHAYARIFQAADAEQRIIFAQSGPTAVHTVAVYDHDLTDPAGVLIAGNGTDTAATTFTAPGLTAPAGRPSLLITGHSPHTSSGGTTYTLTDPPGMTRVNFLAGPAAASFPALLSSQDVSGGPTGTRDSTGSTSNVNGWRALSLVVPGAPGASPNAAWWFLAAQTGIGV